MLTYEQARNTIIEQVGKKRGPRATGVVSVWDALGLVLTQEIRTDREYPPFDRSTRDGYAVGAREVVPGAKLPCGGEIDKNSGNLIPVSTEIQRAARRGNPSGNDRIFNRTYNSQRDRADRICQVVTHDKRVTAFNAKV